MTYLSEVIATNKVSAEVAGGYITAKRHPSLPLTIYTYTRVCQYEGRWNEATVLCRGLIVDDEGVIVARPFPKFFNYGEHGVRDYAPTLNPQPFTVHPKMDGSLGIIFCYEGQWLAASKGSFISEQAQWAQSRLSDPAKTKDLNPQVTYCAELIYPENRIVVDYGGRKDMCLIGGFFADGSELDPGTVTWTLGTVAPTLTNGADLADVQALVGLASTNVHLDGSLANGTDDEGFVLRFADGTRVKVKYAEYVRLHRLMTGVTERDVWRAVAFDDMMARHLLLKDIAPVLKCSKDELDKMLAAPYGALATIVDGTPDEFDAWIRSVEASLLERQNALLQEAVLAYTNVMARVGAGDRGTFARTLMETYGSHKTVMSLCFSLLDNKPLLPTIWKSLYPEASQPFREDEA